MDFSEILNNIGFDWRMALANLVNFLIILLILKKFAFGPIQKKLEERETKIEKGVEDARRAATELQMAETSRDKTLMNARLEADRVIGKSAEKAAKIVDDAKRFADEQQGQIVARAKEVIEVEKEKMLKEVREDVVKTAILATEKIIGKEVDQKVDKEIIKELLD